MLCYVISSSINKIRLCFTAIDGHECQQSTAPHLRYIFVS